MKNYKLEQLLNQYINSPRDAIINFELACEYFNIKQYAPAISYYLRCAELSNNDELVYESLLCSWNCMLNSGGRKTFEKTQLLQLISQSPNRPEGYLSICQWYEFNGNDMGREKQFWQIYSYACIGLNHIKNNKEFKYYNKYPGGYSLLFYKGFAAYHIGQLQESRDIFIDLYNNYDLNGDYKDYVMNNINNLGLGNEINQ